MESTKPKFRLLRDERLTVTNTFFYYDYKENKYKLRHYDTEVLEVKKNRDGTLTIEKALNCSISTRKAIFQVANSILGIPKEEIAKKLIRFTNYYKYNKGYNRVFKKDHKGMYEGEEDYEFFKPDEI